MQTGLNNIICTSTSNDLLRLTVFPTEQCNFRCSYCYEYFDNPQMSQKTLNSLLKFLEQRLTSVKILSINWFGGEPLLAKDIIIKASKVIQNTIINTDTIYIGAITSNGYLLDIHTASILEHCGISNYQITLGGFAKEHNITRKLKNGGETFEVIWNNLLKIKKSDLKISIKIRVNYTKKNYRNLLPFIDFVDRELLNDTRFHIYFKAVEKFGGPNDQYISHIKDEEKYHIEKKLISRLSNTDRLYINNSKFCYAAQLNAFSIRSNGQIQKCDLALTLPENNVGYLKENGTIHIDFEKFTKWSSWIETLDEDDLMCPYKRLTRNK